MQPRPQSIETLKLKAQAAIEYTHAKLSLGSVNKRSDQDRPDFEEARAQLGLLRVIIFNNIKRYLQLANCAGTVLDSFILETQCLAAIFIDCKVGNCLEQSIVALNFLKEAGVDDVDWCSMNGGDHYFLVLNGILICDPWANEVYHVSEFQDKQKLSVEFKYADYVYQAIPNIKPYLFGTPRTLFSTSSMKKPAIEHGEFTRIGIEM